MQIPFVNVSHTAEQPCKGANKPSLPHVQELHHLHCTAHTPLTLTKYPYGLKNTMHCLQAAC